jgi:hypothetical protein
MVHLTQLLYYYGYLQIMESQMGWLRYSKGSQSDDGGKLEVIDRLPEGAYIPLLDWIQS